MQRSDCLVWIDLEMTGLNPDQHVILEIATIITDYNLTIIESGPELIIHQPEKALANMSDFVRDLHFKSDLLKDVAESPTSQKDAEQKTLEFIKKHCERGTACLAGNSIWNDRNFLDKHMPSITEYLHYRMVDVSSIKQLVHNWYPEHEGLKVRKDEGHRALADIKESIDELKQYRKSFFIT